MTADDPHAGGRAGRDQAAVAGTVDPTRRTSQERTAKPFLARARRKARMMPLRVHKRRCGRSILRDLRLAAEAGNAPA